MLFAQDPTLALRFPCAPSWLPFARSDPLPSVLGEKRGALLEEGLPPGGGGREKAEWQLQMELLTTLQQQMEPTGEHFSEERTLLQPGVLSAGWRRDAGSFTEHHGPWHR